LEETDGGGFDFVLKSLRKAFEQLEAYHLDMDTRAGAEVADACLDFLTIEMVNWATNTSSSNEAVYSRLEGLGFDVGVRLAERATRDRPRLQDNLEAFKFLCKDFWTEVFKKQVDNLKTNHRVCIV